MPRLTEPDPEAIPEDVALLLKNLPPDPMFRMLSHATTTMGPLLDFARSLYTGLDLPDRLREVAILALAEATGASFVWTQHVPISAAADIDDPTREAIRAGAFDSPALSEADRAVAQFTAAVAGGPGVSDELFETIRARLSEREIVELLQVLGYYWMLGRLSTVLDIEPTETYETYRDGFLGASSA
jgi:alkylhydroperoxidase family enzyme